MFTVVYVCVCEYVCRYSEAAEHLVLVHLIFGDRASHRDPGLAIASAFLTIPSFLYFMHLKFNLMREERWNIDLLFSQ